MTFTSGAGAVVTLGVNGELAEELADGGVDYTDLEFLRRTVLDGGSGRWWPQLSWLEQLHISGDVPRPCS